MEWYTTEDGKYRIESLSSATFSGALEVMRIAYAPEESVAVGIGVSKNPKAVEELLYICGYVALGGMSLVAVEVNTGEVAAVAFNYVKVPLSESTDMPILVEKLVEGGQDETRGLFEFSSILDGKFDIFEKFGVDCSFEILFLSTLHKHRQQKLGELLCKVSIELARKLKDGPVSPLNVSDLGPEFADLNYRTATTKVPKICHALWTAEATQKIGKNLNFTVHLTISFDEFVFNGKTYSERIGRANTIAELGVIPLY